MTQPIVKPANPITAHPVTSAIITVLVLGSILGTLLVPIYASETPKVGDFPFFYFYLLAYMPAVGIALWIVGLLQRRLRGGSADGTPHGTPDVPEAK